MIRTGNLWTWPSTPDKVFYELGDSVQVISPPEVAGSKTQYKYNQAITTKNKVSLYVNFSRVTHVTKSCHTRNTTFLFLINLLLRCHTCIHMYKLPIRVGLIKIILDYHIL